MILWTPLALSDLDNILNYLSEKNEDVAVHAAKLFDKAVSNIEQFPEIGITGRKENTRELFLSQYSYVIIYRLNGNNTEILRLLHTHQKWTT